MPAYLRGTQNRYKANLAEESVTAKRWLSVMRAEKS